jgi:8-oxo-dGTP diphosphatase
MYCERGSNPSRRAKSIHRQTSLMNQTDQPTIKIVAGLIFRDRRLLVCQRHATATFPLKWEFPGGKVENGESDFDALRRELKEELGIEIHDAELISEYEYVYADGPRVSLCFYKVQSFEGATKNMVFQQMSWVKVTDLGSLDFLEGDRRLIEQLLSSDGEAPSGVERGR